MKNIGQMMKQAQQMQSKMASMQEELAQHTIHGYAGGSLVTVTMNGKGEMKKIKIDPSLIDIQEIEMLEDLILAACNDGKSKVETFAAEKMSQITGGLTLPGGMSLPF